MMIYTVHENASFTDDRRVVLVKEGFCWPAFLSPLNLVWAIHRRVWLGLILYALLLALLAGLAQAFGLGGAVAATLALLIALLAGFEANDFRRLSLKRRGFRETGVVMGSGLAEAEQRYFGNRAS